MAEYTKAQKETAILLLKTLQTRYITYNANDANKEFLADCIIGALDIAIQTLEGEVSG